MTNTESAMLWTITFGVAMAGQASDVAFTKDIAPILQRSCENCHRTGGVAPFPLTTHDEVRPWARAVKNKTMTGEMPPWFIEKNVGIQRFKDDISLSDEEIALIGAWVDNGAPRGNPSDMPPPLEWSDLNEWSIGEPDLIVSSTVTAIKGEAPDLILWLAPSETGLTEDRYIKAVEFKETRLEEPTAARTPDGNQKADLTLWMVHHAIVGTQMPDCADVGGGTSGSRSGNFGHAHELGQNATVYPDGLGVRLPANSSLTWQIHFHSIGKETPARLDLGFKFHPKGYVPTHHLGGGCHWPRLLRHARLLGRRDEDHGDVHGDLRLREDDYVRAAHACRRHTDVSERHLPAAQPRQPR